MNAHEARLKARERLVCAALTLDLAERSLTAGGMRAVNRAEDALELAARDLTNAVDEVPPVARPKGWALDAEGETA
jgi:signal transduction histidine kinase